VASLKNGGRKSSGREGRKLNKTHGVSWKGSGKDEGRVGEGVLQEAMKEGEERETKGNFRRFVEYIKCASIENEVRKKGNLSKTIRRT
jgi:hypothetical protein